MFVKQRKALLIPRGPGATVGLRFTVAVHQSEEAGWSTTNRRAQYATGVAKSMFPTTPTADLPDRDNKETLLVKEEVTDDAEVF